MTYLQQKVTLLCHIFVVFVVTVLKRWPCQKVLIFCLLSFSCPPGLQFGPLPHQVHWEHQPEDLPWVQLGLRPSLGRDHFLIWRGDPLLPQPQELRGVLLTSPELHNQTLEEVLTRRKVSCSVAWFPGNCKGILRAGSKPHTYLSSSLCPGGISGGKHWQLRRLLFLPRPKEREYCDLLSIWTSVPESPSRAGRV